VGGAPDPPAGLARGTGFAVAGTFAGSPTVGTARRSPSIRCAGTR
jgi:hypothetical protein